MESIVDGVNVDIVEKIALGLCAFHTFKTGISSAPCPAFWQFKRYFIADIFDLATNLLIIRVILTTEDDGFLLIPLELTLLDEFFFLCTDAFKQDRSRLVIRVLRHKLAANGEIKDFGFGLGNDVACRFTLDINLLNMSPDITEFLCYSNLFAQRWHRS